MISELEPFVNELKKEKGIIGVGIYGSYARGSSIDVETKDISYHSDVDFMIWINDNSIIRKLYRLRNKYTETSSMEIDLSIHNINVVKYVLNQNRLVMVFFLKILEKTNWLKQTNELKDFIKDCDKKVENDSQLKRFYEEFSTGGQYYALSKDLMNTIISNFLLKNFNF